MTEKAWEMYKKLEDHPTLERCPVCASAAELWRYSKSETAPSTPVAMCSNGEAFGPQDGIANEGCLLFMPPDEFYKATIREAVKYWNEYAKVLTAQQRKRRWEIAQVLRSNGDQS